MQDAFAEKQDPVASTRFDLNQIYMIHLYPELFDLERVLNKPSAVERDEKKLDPEVMGESVGFVKLTENNTDLIFAHATGAGFNTMNRVFKTYKFGYGKDRDSSLDGL
jgi:hypothetical protein